MALIPYINESTTDVGFFLLLTLRDPSTGNQTLLVNNNEDVVSRGNTYQAYPFMVTLPNDMEEEAMYVQITIDNVDQLLVHAIRSTVEPPTAKIELVVSSSPNTVERTIDFLIMTGVQYDAQQITATLQPNDFLNSPAIDSIYTGVEFPDLQYA